MTARIFLKLIGFLLGLLIVALAAADFLASRVAESNYIQTLTLQLEHQGRMLAVMAGGEPGRLDPQTLSGAAKAAGARLTVIAADGSVLRDSEADPARMENHGQRPEFREALAGRPGSSIRQSPTIGIRFLYVAVPTQSGALRLAVPLATVNEQVDSVRRRMMVSITLAFLPAILLAALFARRVSTKLGRIIRYAADLAEGNFRIRLKDGGGELGQLTRRLNETGEKLQALFEEFEREHAELEKLERIRKDFVINVSHELRTPLASIQGYAETLLNGAIDDRENNTRFLAIIQQNAERLGRLTDDLLTLSRLELKTQRFRCASYRVGLILADAVESMQPMAAKKNVRILIDPVPDEMEAFCDSLAVQQILGNLLDNALKCTPEGKTITVGAAPVNGVSGGAESVEVFVRDEGIGIPPEELPRLFERFYRVDKARSRELGGTGLGLAIVKHLARSMGGDVRVESEINQGSTFAFTLPVHDPGLCEPAAGYPELTGL